MTASSTHSASALAGLKVLDATSVIAGPLASMLLGDHGAEILNVEQPHNGDPVRSHGGSKDGVALWWSMLGRNKTCVTLNLRSPEGQEIFRKLAQEADVVIENFRTGTMERWGLGYEVLAQANPGLVMLHITGFGRVGPRSGDPGFGTLAEALSGFAHRTGDPDGPPTLPPFGLADGVTGISAAYALMVALYERTRTGLGQEIDVAISESLLPLLEPQLTTADQLGTDAMRTGSRAETNAPRGIYRTADDRWVAVSASTAATARRLITAVGHQEIADSDWMGSADSRAAHADELDAALVPWFAARTADEALAICRASDAPAGLVYAASDILGDAQFNATGAIASVPHDVLGTLRMPGVGPRLSRTGGTIRWPGRSLGADNADVYRALGISEDEQDRLRERGII